MKNIYVGNLSFNVSEENLREEFAKYGKVVSVKIIHDGLTHQSRGFGFVEMDDKAADDAIAGLNGSSLDGRKIVVSEGRQRSEHRDTGGEKPRRRFGHKCGAFEGARCLSENLVIHIEAPCFQKLRRHVLRVLVLADPFFKFSGGGVLRWQEPKTADYIFEGGFAVRGSWTGSPGGHGLAPSILQWAGGDIVRFGFILVITKDGDSVCVEGAGRLDSLHQRDC